MSIILATGGLDDVAMSLGVTIVVSVFFVVVGLVAFALWKGSLIPAVIATVLILAVGALLQPWTLIALSPRHDAYDAYWLYKLRLISVFWLVLLISTAACTVRVIYQRKQKKVEEAARLTPPSGRA